MLAEVGRLVPVGSMAVHDAQNPQTWHDACQLPLDAVAVLVYFPHLRNETRARINAHLFNDFYFRRLGLCIGRASTRSRTIHSCCFIFLRSFVECRVRPITSNIDTSEVCIGSSLLNDFVRERADLGKSATIRWRIGLCEVEA